MKKWFICMANSKKYSGRCIAGMEVRKIGGQFGLIIRDNQPNWIRPISTGEYGSIQSDLVAEIKLGDIVEIDVTEECPLGFQPENVSFSSLCKRGVWKFNDKLLGQIATDPAEFLFFNSGKAVSTEDIRYIDRSLMFIKPQQAAITLKHYDNEAKTQIRCQFRHGYNDYDFPVTDVDFCSRKHLELPPGKVYLTLSLGLEHEGWHYKLVAGIITVS